MINLAIFGTGRIGCVHAMNAASLSDVMLKYVVDPIESDGRRSVLECQALLP